MLNRANGRARLFADEPDYRSFIELLGEERAGTGMRLLALCPTTGTSSRGRGRTAISAASSAG